MKKHYSTDTYVDLVALLATTVGQGNLFDKTHFKNMCSGWSPSVQWPRTVFSKMNTKSHKQEEHMRKVCLHLQPLLPELQVQIIYMHKWGLQIGIWL